MSNYLGKQYEIEEKTKILKNEIKQEENELELLKELKNLQDTNELEKEKIKINQNVLKQYNEKIEMLHEKQNYLETSGNTRSNEKNERKINENRINKIENKIKLSIVFSIILLITTIVSIYVIKNNIIIAISAICLLLTIINICYTQNKKKVVVINTKNIQNVENSNIKNEIEILNASSEKIKEEIKQITKELEEKLEIEKEKLRNKYMGIIPIKIIDEILSKKTLIYEISILQNKISENKIKLHTIEIDQKNILEKLENLASLEEESAHLEERYNELCNKNEQINLVKEEIEKAYNIMKKQITPKFTNNLSKIIEKITEGKYKNIQLDETKAMVVEIENGNYISIKNLSIGTIDQAYLALRLSVGQEISEEKLPIILDESFIYWDSTRLQNILNYLNEEFKNRQIILFTCTNREIEMLNNLGIIYNKILL